MGKIESDDSENEFEKSLNRQLKHRQTTLTQD